MSQFLTARRVLQVILALGLFVMACRPITDHDIWWHLRTGQLILQNHAAFHTDPYSFTRAGAPWINQEWMSEVFIYCLYRVSGWMGLIFSFAALTAGTFWLLFCRCKGGLYVAVILTLWGAVISAPTWGVRPLTLSLLFTSLFLWILDRSASSPKILWWTVPLTLLWVNLHAEFAVGIGLLSLFLLGAILDSVSGFETWALCRMRIKTLAATILACAAIVPLNPAGWKMFLYPIQTVRSRGIVNYVEEWLSPNFHDHRNLPLLLMILGIMTALAISRQRLRPTQLLLLTVTLAGALHSVRHVGIFVLIAIPMLSELLDGEFKRLGWILSTDAAKASGAKLAVNATILALCMSLSGARLWQVAQEQSKREATALPAAAVEFLVAHNIRGPMLNGYNWGGYLIWKLYPGLRVYIDGRTDLYGDAYLDDFSATYYGRTDHWQRELDKWQIRTVLLPPDAPLISLLRLEPEWNQAYADKIAVIMTRIP